MTTIFCHHDADQLPARSPHIVPVLLYGVSDRDQHASIGNAALKSLTRLPKEPTVQAFDFLTIALAVTAGDTFVDRNSAPDRWCRDLKVVVALNNPTPWRDVAVDLESAFRFLSGDKWTFEFLEGGMTPPRVREQRVDLFTESLDAVDSVALFSGGLDSTIGALDMLSNGRAPLLVSHAYKGDSSIQQTVLQSFSSGFKRFGANLHPVNLREEASDITMRTRSFNFLALAAVAASVVNKIRGTRSIPLIVPENGFIALNPPLTPRRIGSLSTRTTHPYFLKKLEDIFSSIGMGVEIQNPYEFQTKGEMFADCLDSTTLQKVASETMSCSNWKRKGMACGRCVPCLIRRTSFYRAGVTDTSQYQDQLLPSGSSIDIGDDLLAVLIAIRRAKDAPAKPIASRSGPMPMEQHLRDQYDGVIRRGLAEMEQFLKARGIT
jgi:7-cyano-7-deazaguanine synthase in queuosine biosynthesis